MISCDFSRSFVTFVTPGRGNNARIQVEAICTLTDTSAGTTEDYHLVASCKGEDTYGTGVLFLDPSYDFCAIFSPKEFHIIRVGAPYKKMNTVGAIEERFEAVHIDIRRVEAELLRGNDAIVKATLSNRVINARTELFDPAGRYRALVEYPVKTMNVNDIRMTYQVDTGPILLPDFEAAAGRVVERFQLAFIAFNRPDEAYFVIQEPIPALPGCPDSPKICHYSRIVRLAASNTVLAGR